MDEILPVDTFHCRVFHDVTPFSPPRPPRSMLDWRLCERGGVQMENILPVNIEIGGRGGEPRLHLKPLRSRFPHRHIPVSTGKISSINRRRE